MVITKFGYIAIKWEKIPNFYVRFIKIVTKLGLYKEYNDVTDNNEIVTKLIDKIDSMDLGNQVTITSDELYAYYDSIELGQFYKWRTYKYVDDSLNYNSSRNQTFTNRLTVNDKEKNPREYKFIFNHKPTIQDGEDEIRNMLKFDHHHYISINDIEDIDESNIIDVFELNNKRNSNIEIINKCIKEYKHVINIFKYAYKICYLLYLKEYTY